jgi:mannose/fructose/N-acetylgalactosamine-specific phosphotransferase system component IIC
MPPVLGPLARDLPHLFAAAAVAGLIAGLLAVERKGALQLMLARPLVLAPLLGAALGDAAGGLAIGVPLELLTLGGVSLGAATPDNETLLAAALAALVVTAGLWLGTGVDEPLAALGLLMLAPLGLLGRRLERWAETRNVALAEQATSLLEQGDPRGLQLNLRGLWLPFATTAAICAACVLAAPALAALRRVCPPRGVAGLEMGWHFVWALSAAAAVRAIRDPRGPALSAIAAAAVAGAAALMRALP